MAQNFQIATDLKELYKCKMLTWNCFQFAGGFDAESMKAFEELRGRVNGQREEEGNRPET